MGIERVRVHCCCCCCCCCCTWPEADEEEKEKQEAELYDEEMGETSPVLPSGFSSIKAVLGSSSIGHRASYYYQYRGGYDAEEQTGRSSSSSSAAAAVGLRPEDLFRLIASEVIPWASEKRSIRCTFYP